MFDFLNRVAIVVDAFHFAGHKADDDECQHNCDPKTFPVLKTPDKRWLFNSSAAEQVNSWFGKFQPKVKEMNVIRLVLKSYFSFISHPLVRSYNFFLDEVLNIRNSLREDELRRKGLVPRLMDQTELEVVRPRPQRQ